jgi:asparagine synthetase B (glutamine-hydrolysing)
MPRKSQANLSMLQVVGPGTNIEVIHRLRAPAELSDEQRVEFDRVISSMPADWFSPGNMADLVQYCRHVIMARKIDRMIDRAILDEREDHEIERLIKLQVAESKIINQLMTALRMTPQSVAPSTVSQKQLHQTKSPWRGLQEKAREEANEEAG